MIHNILVLKTTGENLFYKSYGKALQNEIITSGFISAAFNFTQMTFKSGIDDIEIGTYRIMFEMLDNIIVCVFFEKSDSIISVRQILTELIKAIHSKYGEILIKPKFRTDELDGLDDIVDKILLNFSITELDDTLKKRYIEILHEFQSNKEILDCDLISGTGVPLIKEWKKDFLELCLRQMDAFWKSENYILDQIIMSYKQRHIILHKINDNLVLSSLIRRNTPLGYATLLIEEVAEKLNKI